MITDIAEEEMRKEGDISRDTADSLYSAFMINSQYPERTKYTRWYLSVLENIRQGRRGNFITTVPFLWLEGDVFSVIRECLALLPLTDRIGEIVCSAVPHVETPGCSVLQDRYVSLTASRAGIVRQIMPDVVIFPEKLPGLEKWARNSTRSFFRETLTFCMMESAVKTGIPAGAAFCCFEKGITDVFPFSCRQYEVFSGLMSLDLRELKSEISKEGKAVGKPEGAVRIFADCDAFLSFGKSVIINIGNGYFLSFDKNIEDVLISGFTGCIENRIKPRLRAEESDAYLER